MKDLIVGRVTEVIDQETIGVEVTQIVRNRYLRYNAKEKIRFKTLQNRWNTLMKARTKGFIESLLKGKGVMCLVTGRSPDGYLEADVFSL